MKYQYLKEVDSTNLYCKEKIDNISDCSVVYTFKQTAGRGRFNRAWVDLGEDNLFLSIVLKPSEQLIPVYSNLTQYTSLVLAKTFSKYGVKPKIKWPNDILINGKKISGILAETAFRENKLKGIIIGVGINLNAEEKDFSKIDKEVTSLNLEISNKVDKMEFLENFINEFFKNYKIFLENGFSCIKTEYESYINFMGCEVTIDNQCEKYKGIVKEITNDGAIVINGRKFFTGDIL